MGQREYQDDDEEEVLPIPLDGETIRRLARFGRAVGCHPVELAASLLREVLEDDERAHQPLN